MHISAADVPAQQFYHLLTQTVIPRPIAWVLSDNGKGEGMDRYNLAPFSFFNAMASDPPMLAFAISRKEGGSKKDTWVNLENQRFCTVHIGQVAQHEPLVDSSVELPHGVSELHRQAYELVTHDAHPTPRIAEAPIAFFCELDHMHPLGKGITAVAFCRIHHIFINDAVVKTLPNGRIVVSAAGVDPLARLGGREYAKLGDIFQLDRPTK
ncbi:MAG: flavin reductase family protein [Proteobacteria bacterium]|nr:flavin reductase family protein [Pseudomonadota bacterium]